MIEPSTKREVRHLRGITMSDEGNRQELLKKAYANLIGIKNNPPGHGYMFELTHPQMYERSINLLAEAGVKVQDWELPSRAFNGEMASSEVYGDGGRGIDLFHDKHTGDKNRVSSMTSSERSQP
jgi:hypothetical protein